MIPIQKTQSIYKRYQSGNRKGRFIKGSFSTPEIAYLAKSQWTFSEKLDGMSCRVGYNVGSSNLRNVEVAGRTDRAQIPEGLQAHFDSIYTPKLFESAGLSDITLYGEGLGKDIQGGGNYGEEQTFVVFDVNIEGYWLSRENVADVCSKLGVKCAPEVGQGTLQDAVDIVSSGITFDSTGAVVRWGRGGLQSKLGLFEAEGLVCRPMVNLFNNNGERIIVKVKAVDFK